MGAKFLKKELFVPFLVLIYVTLTISCVLHSNGIRKDERSSVIDLKDQISISSNKTNFQIEGFCEKCESFLLKVGPSSLTNCDSNSDSVAVEKTFSFDVSSYADGLLKLCLWGKYEGQAMDNRLLIEWTKDTVAPIATSVYISGEGYYNSTTASPMISWSTATDESSGVSYYELAIGSSAGASDIGNWSYAGSSTSFARDGLILAVGQTYYPSLRAIDKAGNVSAAIQGSGWVVDNLEPTTILSFNDLNFSGISETGLMKWSPKPEITSLITKYQLAIGTTPGSSDISSWQDMNLNLMGKITGLTLSHGQTYYSTVRSVDTFGRPTVLQGNGFKAVGNWVNLIENKFYSDSSANKIKIQADGKKLISGSFSYFGGTSVSNIGKLNADGTLDSSFVSGSGFNNSVNFVVTQSSDKYVIGGKFTSYNGTSSNRIIRLNDNGTVDSSFNVGSGFDDEVITIKNLPDNKVLVAGKFIQYNGSTANHIVRLNNDGSLDSSFNSGSGVSGGLAQISAMDIQSDSKIILGGSFTSYNGNTTNYIVRLNSDGSYDSTFSIGSGFNGEVKSLSIQSSDGKIVVGGAFTSFAGTTQNRITRLQTSGSRDTGFNIGTGFNNTVFSVIVISSGKIVVGGNFTTFNTSNSRNGIARVSSTGSVDSSFNTATGAENVYQVVEQSDGKIIGVGGFTLYKGLTAGGIFRTVAGGVNEDSAFTPGTGFRGDTLAVNSISLNSTGKIIVVGNFMAFNPPQQNKLVRLNADNSIDGTFSCPVISTEVFDIEVDGNGKIYAGNSIGVFKLNSVGTVDSSFTGGDNYDGYVYSIEIDGNGKVIIGGTFTDRAGTSQNYISRLNTDGSLDSSFNLGTGFDNHVYDIKIDSSNKILVAGGFSDYNGNVANKIIRLNADGSVDTSFNAGSGFDSMVFSIVLLADGKILLGGDFSSYDGASANKVIRLNNDGSIDSSFYSGLGFNSYVRSLKVQSDGQIIAVGDFTQHNGAAYSRMARLDKNGSLDTSFTIGSGYDGIVEDITIDSDGKINAVGYFTHYNSKYSPGFSQLGW